MAVTTVPITDITVTGEDPTSSPTTPTHATDGIQFSNDGRTLLYVLNSNGATPVVLTFVTPKTVGGLAVANPTVSVAAVSAYRLIGPFPRDVYNDGNGRVVATSDGNGTDLRCKAYRM